MVLLASPSQSSYSPVSLPPPPDINCLMLEFKTNPNIWELQQLIAIKLVLTRSFNHCLNLHIGNLDLRDFFYSRFAFVLLITFINGQ